MTNETQIAVEATPDESPSTLRDWLLLFAGTLVLYGLTANRGAQWQDSGAHIWRIITGDLLNERGLALSHPLHYYLGRLAIAPGLRAPAHAITLVSALCGAVAVANTYGCVRALTRCRTSSVLAAVSLALAHTVWQMATITETYTLVIALLSAELWAMVMFQTTGRAGFAWLMALMNGLGVANHMQASLTTPLVLIVAYGGMSRRQLTIKHLLAGTTLWLVGSLPYSALVFSEWMRSGDLAATLASALFGRDFAPAVMHVVPSAHNALVTVGFASLNFPNLLLPLAGLGLLNVWRFRRKLHVQLPLGAALIVHAAFALRYQVVDQHTFFLPTYLLLCIFGGMGLSDLLAGAARSSRSRWVGAVVAMLTLTPLIYATAPRVARSLGVLEGIERHKPYRDDYDYLLIPWSFAETSADRMSRHAEQLAQDGSTILYEDRMAEGALHYQLRRREPGTVARMPADQVADLQTLADKSALIVLVPSDRDAPTTPPPAGGWHRTGDLYTNKPPGAP